MILSVSRRTDVPACYMPWFMNRLRAGEVLVRNPMNPRQVRRIRISPDVVDCIVFWTKVPGAVLPVLPEIACMGYSCMFQVTVNPYGSPVEPALPPLQERIAAVQALAEAAGKHRVIWRYDPIVMSEAYTVGWHAERFAAMVGQLAGSVRKGVISFLDEYAKIRVRLRQHGLRTCREEEMNALAAAFAPVAARHHLPLQTCAEKVDLSAYGIGHGACLDARDIAEAIGRPLQLRRNSNQRPECGCVQSIDVGAYNTCHNGCVYCYANHSPESVARRAAAHRVDSPMLTGVLNPQDAVIDVKAVPCRKVEGEQLTLL